MTPDEFSILDGFAAHALSGLLASQVEARSIQTPFCKEEMVILTRQAYAFAVSMMTTRRTAQEMLTKQAEGGHE